MENENLEELVKEVLKDLFPTATIHRVVVRADVDNDGDKVLRITVVLDEDRARVDREALVGFVRHLKSKLTKVHREEFPLLSFVSKSEAKKLNLESV